MPTKPPPAKPKAPKSPSNEVAIRPPPGGGDDASFTLPADVRAILGGPVVAGFEDEAEFEALLCALFQEVRPRGVVEQLLVSDFVQAAWDARRARRAVATTLNLMEQQSVTDILTQSDVDPGTAGTVARTRRAQAVSEIMLTGIEEHDDFQTTLGGRGLDAGAVTSNGFRIALGDIERMEKLASAADQRRINAMREIHRHRATLADRVQSAMGEVTDAEFVE